MNLIDFQEKYQESFISNTPNYQLDLIVWQKIETGDQIIFSTIKSVFRYKKKNQYTYITPFRI